MARAYDILRKLENGEILRIASRSDLAQAWKLAESLNAYWPAEYIVRESSSGVELRPKEERLATEPQGAHKSQRAM